MPLNNFPTDHMKVKLGSIFNGTGNGLNNNDDIYLKKESDGVYKDADNRIKYIALIHGGGYGAGMRLYLYDYPNKTVPNQQLDILIRSFSGLSTVTNYNFKDLFNITLGFPGNWPAWLTGAPNVATGGTGATWWEIIRDAPSNPSWNFNAASQTTYLWGAPTMSTIKNRLRNEVFQSMEAYDAPDKVANPTPSNAGTDVAAGVVLSWDAATLATSYDVYFGTNPDPSGDFQGNQAGITFDPSGDLDGETTYYWRIDSRDANMYVKGDVWSFTTAAAPVTTVQKSLFQSGGTGKVLIDENGNVLQLAQ